MPHPAHPPALAAFWQCIESVRGRCAVAAAWRRWLGEDFETCRSAFFKRRATPAASFPCPHDCGCQHAVLPLPDGRLIAVCCCDEPRCEDLLLQPADLTLWELDVARLARALCGAFGLDSRFVEIGVANTWQIGSWSTDAVSAILTVQPEPSEFRAAVAELAARLRGPFLLFAPTAAHLDAVTQQLLAGVGAAFFPLESNLRLPETGRLYPIRNPGELFSRFTPQPAAESDQQETARKAFALVRQLDSEQRLKAPSLMTVFRLYCVEAKGIGEIARRFDTSKTTILRRLELIQTRTGVAPATLRTLSPHLAKMEDEFADPRARHIHRRSLIYDGEDAESET